MVVELPQARIQATIKPLDNPGRVEEHTTSQAHALLDLGSSRYLSGLAAHSLVNIPRSTARGHMDLILPRVNWRRGTNPLRAYGSGALSRVLVTGCGSSGEPAAATRPVARGPRVDNLSGQRELLRRTATSSSWWATSATPTPWRKPSAEST